MPERRSDEDECSSSTSSTERSEGDCRERYNLPQLKYSHHTSLLFILLAQGGLCYISAVSYFLVLWVICRKTESSDMQDLVHMMTQTLSMDIGDSVNEVDKGRLGSTALPEFKLNRKYRDTLVLHGKAREEAENLSLGEIPIGQML